MRARPSRFTLSSDEEEELEEAVNSDVRVHEAPTVLIGVNLCFTTKFTITLYLGIPNFHVLRWLHLQQDD